MTPEEIQAQRDERARVANEQALVEAIAPLLVGYNNVEVIGAFMRILADVSIRCGSDRFTTKVTLFEDVLCSINWTIQPDDPEAAAKSLAARMERANVNPEEVKFNGRLPE